MKAITVCQPYAHLILLPDSHPDFKRTENRMWHTGYTGPLLIHAGKSRSWLETDDDDPSLVAFCDEPVRVADLVFGAIVGVVDQVGCWPAAALRAGMVRGLEWLKGHSHIEGPMCHVYLNPRRFETPVPYKGSQGFFDVPDAVVAEAIARAEAVPSL
jgi:hypothetical protein